MRSIFKQHGGKKYLAKWIVGYLPRGYEQSIFIEPFCGAANVTLIKTPSATEVLNDIDPGIIAILQAVRDTPRHFMARLRAISYTEDSFQHALNAKEFTTDLDLAVNEFVRRRMSRGGLKKSFAWSDRLRGGKPGDVNAYQTVIEQIPVISERLRDVQIYHQTALQVIDTFDDENTIIYADPPYVKSTRRSTEVYLHEMSDDEHRMLGERLRKFKGKVLISGYPSKLYDEELFPDWHRTSKMIANHASQQRIKKYKEEVIFVNYLL